MKINEENLRSVIRGEMEDTRLSLQELANKAGMHITELYSFMSGQHTSLRAFLSLCEALELNMVEV